MQFSPQEGGAEKNREGNFLHSPQRGHFSKLQVKAGSGLAIRAENWELELSPFMALSLAYH